MPEEQQTESSRSEQALIDAINNKCDDDVNRLLDKPTFDCNYGDKNGTTLLMHASFRGNRDAVAALIAKGADVNLTNHDQGYTPLMFGALSGCPEVCKLLLDHGARPEEENKIGKTAVDLANFTGTQAPKLPKHITAALKDFARTDNVHPVKTLLFLSEHPEWFEHETVIKTVLEDMTERQMKRKDTNEVMAFKIHILFTTVKAAFKKLAEAKQSQTTKTSSEVMLSYAKSLLGDLEGSYPVGVDKFLRQAVREFPFHQSVLMQQTVRTLAKTPIGQQPDAWSVIHQTLMGRGMIQDHLFCGACGNPDATKRCSVCKVTHYCSAKCQKLHWSTHKKLCDQLQLEQKTEKLWNEVSSNNKDNA